MLLVSDSLNSMLPKILNKMYNFVGTVHYYRTRNSLNCKLLLPKLILLLTDWVVLNVKVSK